MTSSVVEDIGPLNLVCLKAFGDLVIAVSAIDAVADTERKRLRLVIAAHLSPLAAALGADVNDVIDHRESGVPSLFDIRKRGLGNAVKSALSLRRGVARVVPDSARVLLDRADRRAAFVFGKRPLIGLPQHSPNIYLAYRAALEASDLPIMPRASDLVTAQDSVAIFPGSRVAAKNLPMPVVQRLLEACARANRGCRLMLLEGERPDIEASGLRHEIIPRDFARMKAAVESNALVISADSLPAHLAERGGLPVFVVTPVDNSYWLPLSAYDARAWALFDEYSGGWARLDDFLQRPSNDG